MLCHNIHLGPNYFQLKYLNPIKFPNNYLNTNNHSNNRNYMVTINTKDLINDKISTCMICVKT